MKSKFTLITVLILLTSFFQKSYGQADEDFQGWCIYFSSGQSFVDYKEYLNNNFEYSTGISYEIEARLGINRYISFAPGILHTTSHRYSKNISIYEEAILLSQGAKVFNQYQTTLATKFLLNLVNTRKSNLFIGAAPTYTFGNSVFSSAGGEVATILAENINTFGYLGTFGYQFNLNKNWRIGTKYIFSKHRSNSEHILLSIGYKIN